MVRSEKALRWVRTLLCISFNTQYPFCLDIFVLEYAGLYRSFFNVEVSMMMRNDFTDPECNAAWFQKPKFEVFSSTDFYGACSTLRNENLLKAIYSSVSRIGLCQSRTRNSAIAEMATVATSYIGAACEKGLHYDVCYRTFLQVPSNYSFNQTP
jgi:hypothetical protein